MRGRIVFVMRESPAVGGSGVVVGAEEIEVDTPKRSCTERILKAASEFELEGR